MERNKKGQFTKGHVGYGKGTGWKNEKRTCKCGKGFNPRKKFQKSCSQSCAMVGTHRRLGKKMNEATRLKVSKGWFKKGVNPPKIYIKRGYNPKCKLTQFKKGSSGFIGKHTEATKKKIRESRAKQGSNVWNKGKEYLAIRGEKHPNWKGGKSFEPYTIEWRPQLKKQVKERDGMLCQLCFTSKKLSVHHIDYNKANCSLTNLITLCLGCNSKVNYGRKDWENYFIKLLCKR